MQGLQKKMQSWQTKKKALDMVTYPELFSLYRKINI